MTRILLLGGTTEASRMASLLAGAGVDAVFSYAGRTAAPLPQPIPVRIGGFGGPGGLAAWLRAERITQVIDATHPFAERISRNAIAACAETGVLLMGLERPAWEPMPEDDWVRVPDMIAAAAALPDEPTRVFLAIGRQQLDLFVGKRHAYLLRLVDAPQTPPLPGAEVIVARGPFTEEGVLALLTARRMRIVVAKNSGGAQAKIAAARRLGLRVVLVDRPVLPPRRVTADPAEALRWIHAAPLGV